MTKKPREYELNDAAAVAAHYGGSSVLTRDKTMTRLDKYARQFIACAPFMVMATASADGDLDASHEGDAPGFVHIIEDVTLAIPDWPGNRRVDGAYNIVTTGRIGMLFMISGMNEALRVNGRASMTTDRDEAESPGFTEKQTLLVTARTANLPCPAWPQPARCFAPRMVEQQIGSEERH